MFIRNCGAAHISEFCGDREPPANGAFPGGSGHRESCVMGRFGAEPRIATRVTQTRNRKIIQPTRCCLSLIWAPWKSSPTERPVRLGDYNVKSTVRAGELARLFKFACSDLFCSKGDCQAAERENSLRHGLGGNGVATSPPPRLLLCPHPDRRLRNILGPTISDYRVCPCTDISLSSEIVRLAIFRDNERNPPSCAVSASCDFPESQV